MNRKTKPAAKKTSAEQPLEQYHTVAQVAARLHKHPNCVRGWIAAGLLKRTMAASSMLISETQLQKFLTESTRRANAA